MKLGKPGTGLSTGLSRHCNKARFVVFLFLLGCMLLLAGCAGRKKEMHAEGEMQQEASGFVGSHGNGAGTGKRKVHVWAVYWDNKDVVRRLENLQEEVDGISYFAAYFDSEKKMFLPENVMGMKAAIENSGKNGKMESYLTFVNDLLKKEGGSSLKDKDLFYYLLSSKESRQRHISDILEMTEQGSFDGVEIDYEAMKKDMELWKLFASFVNELYGKTSERGMKLRVILEPGAPVEELGLVKGPEYVFMCYNLYGYGTEPGPKADENFLISMVEKGKILPGETYFAVANGGFDFIKASGETEQISTEEAILRQSQAGDNKTIRRDEKSGCKVYSYKDSKGREHEVWYADDETLNFWYGILEREGAKGLSLWRLGG